MISEDLLGTSTADGELKCSIPTEVWGEFEVLRGSGNFTSLATKTAYFLFGIFTEWKLNEILYKKSQETKVSNN